MENAVTASPGIRSGLVLGSGRSCLALLVELDRYHWGPTNSERTKELAKDRLWPVVDKANQDSPPDCLAEDDRTAVGSGITLAVWWRHESCLESFHRSLALDCVEWREWQLSRICSFLLSFHTPFSSTIIIYYNACQTVDPWGYARVSNDCVTILHYNDGCSLQPRLSNAKQSSRISALWYWFC